MLTRVLTLFQDDLTRLCLTKDLKDLENFDQDLLCQSLSARWSESDLVVGLVRRNVGRIREFRLMGRRQIFLLMAYVLRKIFRLIRLTRIFFPYFISSIRRSKFLR